MIGLDNNCGNDYYNKTYLKNIYVADIGILYELGNIYGPASARVSCGDIERMISRGRKVYEILADGSKIRLTSDIVYKNNNIMNKQFEYTKPVITKEVKEDIVVNDINPSNNEIEVINIDSIEVIDNESDTTNINEENNPIVSSNDNTEEPESNDTINVKPKSFKKTRKSKKTFVNEGKVNGDFN